MKLGLSGIVLVLLVLLLAGLLKAPDGAGMAAKTTDPAQPGNSIGGGTDGGTAIGTAQP